MANILFFISKPFRSIKQLGPLTNRSRLFNSYESIFEILLIILNYSLFRITNQLIFCHILLVFSIIAISANYLTNITHPMRFFYSACLNILSSVLAFILTLVLFSALLNVSELCRLFSNYVNRQLNTEEQPNYLQTCFKQRLFYIIWFLLNIFATCVRGVGIYFSLKAHSKIKPALMKDKRNIKFE